MKKLLISLTFLIFVSAGVLPAMEVPVDSNSDNSEYQILMDEISRTQYSLHCKENKDVIFAFENIQMNSSDFILDLCKKEEYSLPVFITELISHINNSPDIEELSCKFKDGYFTLKKPFLAIAYRTGPEYTPDTVRLYNLTTKNNITMLMMAEDTDYCLSIEKIIVNRDCSELIILADFGEGESRCYTTNKAPMMILKDELSLYDLRNLRDNNLEYLDWTFEELDKLGK